MAGHGTLLILANLFWIGHLGTVAVAAVSLCGNILFSAPMFPLVSAMNGAGDTQPPMIAAFVASWLIKLPLCYALAIPLAYGVDGIWVGMFISIVFEAVVMFAWYRRGTWKTKKL